MSSDPSPPRRTGAPFAALALLLLGCAPSTPEADLVFLGGQVVTLGPDGTVEALAVLDDRVLAVGSTDEIRGHIGPSTRVVELDGRSRGRDRSRRSWAP